VVTDPLSAGKMPFEPPGKAVVLKIGQGIVNGSKYLAQVVHQAQGLGNKPGPGVTGDVFKDPENPVLALFILAYFKGPPGFGGYDKGQGKMAKVIHCLALKVYKGFGAALSHYFKNMGGADSEIQIVLPVKFCQRTLNPPQGRHRILPKTCHGIFTPLKIDKPVKSPIDAFYDAIKIKKLFNRIFVQGAQHQI